MNIHHFYIINLFLFILFPILPHFTFSPPKYMKVWRFYSVSVSTVPFSSVLVFFFHFFCRTAFLCYTMQNYISALIIIILNKIPSLCFFLLVYLVLAFVFLVYCQIYKVFIDPSTNRFNFPFLLISLSFFLAFPFSGFIFFHVILSPCLFYTALFYASYLLFCAFICV